MVSSFKTNLIKSFTVGSSQGKPLESIKNSQYNIVCTINALDIRKLYQINGLTIQCKQFNLPNQFNISMLRKLQFNQFQHNIHNNRCHCIKTNK